MFHLSDVETLPKLPGAFLTVWRTEKVRLNIFVGQFIKYFCCCKGEQNGYNIPELTPASELEKIMSETFAEELRGNPNMALGDQAKRLVSDAYMCFYQSPDVKMYR